MTPRTRHLFVAALVTGSLGLAAPVSGVPAHAAQACGGTIFLDRDADGIRVETLERDHWADDIEPGVAGATITVTDRTDGVHTTRSRANGSWHIDLHPDAFPIRIDIEPPPGYAPGSRGVSSGGTVQFAAAPEDCSANDTGNLGVYLPDEFCADQPELAVACYVIDGTPGDSEAAAIRAVSTGIVDSGTDEEIADDGWRANGTTAIATVGEVGAVFGQAVAPDGSIYAAAFTKRHTSLATTLNPDGNPTAIYRIDPDGVIERFFTVDRSAAAPHSDPAGDRHDLDAFNHVFTSGLGDLEISADGTSLFTTDLGKRELVEIDIETARIMQRVPLNAANLHRSDCNVSADAPFGDLRAFGLGWATDGGLLVGVVCSAESSVQAGVAVAEVGAAGPGAGDHAQLAGYVFEFSGGLFIEKLAWSLESDRGETAATTLLSNKAIWHPWVDAYPFDAEPDAVSYPQPAITDLVVTADGDLVIALGDRFAHQTAPRKQAPAWDGTTRLVNEPISGGDLQHACRRAGRWVIEGTDDCRGGFGDGWEFYAGDRYGYHGETALGALARLPWRRDVIATHIDPVDTNSGWWSGGVVWHDPDDGVKLDGARVYDGRFVDPRNTFEHAAGVGGIAVMCGDAPMQIGGAIFHDADRDGFHDPTERAVPAARVALTDADGDTLATATTDANGVYEFRDEHLEHGFVEGAIYTVVLTSENTTAGGVLTGTGQFTGLVPATPSGATSAVAGDDPTTDEREPAIRLDNNIALVDRYDLAVSNSVGPRTFEDGMVSFLIEIDNEGSLPSGPFELVTNLPPETSLVATGAGNLPKLELEPGGIRWIFDWSRSILPGHSTSFEMVLQVNDPSATEIDNHVTIAVDSGDDADSTPGNETDEDDNDSANVPIFGLSGALWSEVVGDDLQVLERSDVTGAVVELLDHAGAPIATATTDDSGRFLLSALPAGTYSIAIPASEFERGRPLHGHDRAFGAHRSEVGAALDQDGAVRSLSIVIGDGSAIPPEVHLIELGFSRKPPRPMIDYVVPLIVVPLIGLAGIGLTVQRRRQFAVTFDPRWEWPEGGRARAERDESEREGWHRRFWQRD